MIGSTNYLRWFGAGWTAARRAPGGNHESRNCHRFLEATGVRRRFGASEVLAAGRDTALLAEVAALGADRTLTYDQLAEAIADGDFEIRAKAIPLTQVQEAWADTGSRERIVLVP